LIVGSQFFNTANYFDRKNTRRQKISLDCPFKKLTMWVEGVAGGEDMDALGQQLAGGRSGEEAARYAHLLLIYQRRHNRSIFELETLFIAFRS
jgi:hypothetical protein